MQKLILLFFLGVLSTGLKAQNHGVVKAVVLDSLNKQPVPFATVSVLKPQDSSLISYTITDKNGVFTLRNLREEPSRLLISHIGYQSLHIHLIFKKGEIIDLGNLYLAAKMLEEVTIKGERVPVIIKKDTIEFNAEAFKTRPNAVVEDLLKKLPGVQVDHDGRITVNGKDISKIKIDGKDFFASDPTIATKNLDADMISKVQVYDDRENDPDHLVPGYQVKKIINLKFKKKFKKSTLANVEAGAGTDERYEAKGFFSKFQDDLQISGRVNSDNLSGTNTFNQMGHIIGFQGGSGISKLNTGNFNFNNKITKNINLNIEYEARDNVTDSRSATQRQQFIGDTIFNNNSLNTGHQYSNDQNLAIKTEWKPDTVTIIKYEPTLNYNYNSNDATSSSLSSTNFDPLLSENTGNTYGNGSSVQYQHNINYYRKLKNNASLSVTNLITIHPQHNISFNNSDLVSYTQALQSDTLRRSAKTLGGDDNGSLSVNYHLPINKKLSADISVSGSHDRNKGDLFTYDQDLKTGLYTIFLQDQSSDLIRGIWQQSTAEKLTYNFNDKISLRIGLEGQLQQISNHFNSYTGDLDQHFAYLLPTAQLDFNKVHFSYGSEVRQPAINDLQPIAIVYSPLFTFIGNPNLKPTRLHHFGLNYFDYHNQSQLSIYLSSAFTIESNTVLRERTVTAGGAEITTPINRNGRLTASTNFGIGKNFKKQNKWQISILSNINVVAGHNFFDVNQQGGYQNTYAVIFSESATANWNDVIEIRPGYSINSAITKYQFVDYAGTSFTSQHATMGADFFLPQKFTWSADYAYSYNPLVAEGFKRSSNLLSFSVARRMQKNDKGEFRLTCYDVLNQSVSSYHYASENTINDSQNILQRRYFLLSYSYKFSGFKN